jgi:hypothetical protein
MGMEDWRNGPFGRGSELSLSDAGYYQGLLRPGQSCRYDLPMVKSFTGPLRTEYRVKTPRFIESVTGGPASFKSMHGASVLSQQYLYKVFRFSPRLNLPLQST